MSEPHIVYDIDGWWHRHRLTHRPSGLTVARRPRMQPAEWDAAVDRFLSRFPDLEIRKLDGTVIGTTGDAA